MSFLPTCTRSTIAGANTLCLYIFDRSSVHQPCRSRLHGPDTAGNQVQTLHSSNRTSATESYACCCPAQVVQRRSSLAQLMLRIAKTCHCIKVPLGGPISCSSCCGIRRGDMQYTDEVGFSAHETKRVTNGWGKILSTLQPRYNTAGVASSLNK
jgi:hypothetical protein